MSRVLAVTDAAFTSWIAELAKPHVNLNRETPGHSRLEGHLKRYTARNTFDYFIHKDLGGFLRRELDFYVKNEVMHLDDIESDTAPRVEQYLSKIKVIRRIAGKVIDFLAQLEDFPEKAVAEEEVRRRDAILHHAGSNSGRVLSGRSPPTTRNARNGYGCLRLRSREILSR